MLGTYALSAGYYDAYYGKAQKVRTLIRRDFEQAFARVDVIVAPTTPGVAFKIGEKDDPLQMYLTDIFTIPVNLAGLPGRLGPGGFTQAGLPIGLQLIGRAFDEATLLRAAHAYEQATDVARAAASPEPRHERRPRAALRGRHRPRGPRPARDARPRCSAAARATFGAPPNTQTCPVCLGMPGTLPVINRRAVEFGIETALALDCAVNAREPLRAQALLLPGPAEELPDQPVRGAAGRARRASTIDAGGGARARSASSASTSRRTSASSSTRAPSRPRSRASVDFNRAGVPLMEIVSEPDLRSPEEAAAYLRALRADPALPRRLRRQHGGGLAALRRQRLAPAARAAPSSAPRSRSRT